MSLNETVVINALDTEGRRGEGKMIALLHGTLGEEKKFKATHLRGLYDDTRVYITALDHSGFANHILLNIPHSLGVGTHQLANTEIIISDTQYGARWVPKYGVLELKSITQDNYHGLFKLYRDWDGEGEPVKDFYITDGSFQFSFD